MKPGEVFDTLYSTRPEGWGFSERRSQLFRYQIYLDLLSHVAAPRSVLELGCGEGFFSSMLKNQFRCDVAGIDLSSVAIGRARKRYPGIDFHEASVTAIPWERLGPCRYPDLVTAGEVLYYLELPEQRACIADIRRSISAGSHVLASVNIGPRPYFSRADLISLFEGFRCVAGRGIYLRSFHKYVESHIWNLRCRATGWKGKLLAAPLKYAPIRFIDAASRRYSETEESIYAALFRRES